MLANTSVFNTMVGHQKWQTSDAGTKLIKIINLYLDISLNDVFSCYMWNMKLLKSMFVVIIIIINKWFNVNFECYYMFVVVYD